MQSTSQQKSFQQSSTIMNNRHHEYDDDDEYIVNGIGFMNFRILSSDEIQRHSVVKVCKTILYDGNNNNPSKYGLLDKRLG